jgi:hypothetical protein
MRRVDVAPVDEWRSICNGTTTRKKNKVKYAVGMAWKIAKGPQLARQVRAHQTPSCGGAGQVAARRNAWHRRSWDNLGPRARNRQIYV